MTRPRTNTARTLGLIACLALAPAHALAQSATNLEALRGLAPVSALPATAEGKAALAANLTVTGDIQMGRHPQPLLLPFAEQQRLALRDCFITDGNAAQLADGLGTALGDAYQAKARYEDFKTFTSVSGSLARLIGYTNNITKSDSNAGKYFFANATTNGEAPVSEPARAILTKVGGTTDVFGKTYGRPAGTPGADAFGNSRPFQTEPSLLAYRGEDYFGAASHSMDWLRGPKQNLTDSPSYPSGHTTYGYTESLLLALLVPERYQQMIARGAEYGNNRIVVGAHYAMDVLGGRAVALHAVAHLLANDPAYVGQTRANPAIDNEMSRATDGAVTISDYPEALKAARAELQAFLRERCGDTVAACAAADRSRFKDAAANGAFYASTQTYGLPVVHRDRSGQPVDVARVAPEAGHLLTAAFPAVTLDEANAILTATLGPAGGFLDDGSVFGLYSRLDLYAAGGKAASLAASRRATAP
ncbi:MULTISPECIES: phosphatase PAP2 family protein [unclassified Methylobacterium]|uniref:phosphatase PAP2 family protein n=1 Tax=unclassified Methylobacterium TaxID=2615210 RepID=UPI0006F76604|nr:MULTISPECIES: phosphatase PAP2 family protein [unclassified Methylobacterium]KQO58218.1 PA-phosphatase [Methylobacterium sp. Leaf86]KQO97280.1 PA-phosphatase [Methylobacterium sp. Leaf91]